MSSLEKHALLSKKIVTLVLLNALVLGTLIFFGFMRMSIGFVRDKPLAQICMVVGFLIVYSFIYITYLRGWLCNKTIPKFYKREIIPNRAENQQTAWDYVVFGAAALSLSLVPLAGYADRNSSSNSAGCGSGGCSSGDGGGCGGSGCGGCGGGD
jgi:uncharacterized membrane protein YgcG